MSANDTPICKNCGNPHWPLETCEEAMRELPASRGSVDVREYLRCRRRTIESSIAAEMLAGNEWKEKCERTALAEITALEAWLANPQVH